MSVANTYDRGRRIVLKNQVALVLFVVVLLLLGDLIWKLSSGELAVSELVRYTWDGLMRGLVIGLAGIGLSLTYSILGFANFAHGDYITTGAFAGWATSYVVAGFGSRVDIGALVLVGAGGSVFGGALGINVANTPLAVILGALVAGLATIVLALGVDRFAYKPIRDAGGIPLLITSVGVAFVLRYLLLFVFGSTTRGTTNINMPSRTVNIVDGSVTFTIHDLALIVVAGGLMLGVHLLLQWTKLGKAMRAMSDNESLARISGIPTEGIIRYTWIIGGGLTGVAGYMFILWRGSLGFDFGWLLLLLIFAAVILGGIGSIYGAIVGGLVIGVTASTAVIWLPAQFARAAAFFVMIVVLLVRPQGIFSGRATA